MKRELALSFVSVTLGGVPACQTGRTTNPPPPQTTASPDSGGDGAIAAEGGEQPTQSSSGLEACPTDIEAGTDCDHPNDWRCEVPGQWDACGLNGWECRDGKWQDLFTSCNPPPAER